MTNNGDILNKIMRAGNYHEKEYLVTIDKPVTEAFLKKMSGGLYLKELEVRTRPCKVSSVGEFTFQIILTRGTKPSDSSDVCGLWLPCPVTEAGSNHEYRAWIPGAVAFTEKLRRRSTPYCWKHCKDSSNPGEHRKHNVLFPKSKNEEIRFFQKRESRERNSRDENGKSFRKQQ